MYSFRYDSWDETRFPGYQTSMNKLYEKSLTFYYKNQYNASTEKADVLKILELFGYMEYYLAALLKNRYIGKSNFENVLEQLKSIRLVKLLDPKLRSRLNGLTYDGVVMMNPTPGLYLGLDESQSLQLTLFHELGHIITSANKDDLECIKELVFPEELKHDEFDTNSFESFSKGFDLLDEVAVQNAGEEVLYDRLKVPRPEVVEFTNKLIYPGGVLHTNFSTYREFQEVAAKFARCLSFLHPKEEDDMNSILKKLSKAMFSRDFFDKLYLEFESPEKQKDLVLMLICMGKIKDAKYSSFGMGIVKREDFDKSIYFKIIDELVKNNDCTEYGEDQKVQS